MRVPYRRALAAALVSGAAAAPLALAAPQQTTVRVEGQSQTLVPESAITVDDQGTTTFFDATTFAPLDAANNSVLAQLGRAASSAGIDMRVRLFDFGTGPLAFIDKLGPDAGAGSVGWSFRVDRAQPGFASANQVLLTAGRSVVWYYGSAGARTLDLSVSADRVKQGAPVDVTVMSYDDTGAGAPAAGATVTYGDAVAVADAAGAARFVGQGVGTKGMQATRAGDVRSPSRSVCSYTTDPTVCNLPPAPATPAPAAPATPAASTPVATTQASTDTSAPSSRIGFPRSGRAHRAVRAVRGAAGPDRSDVARVEVALAQRVGTQCRFRQADGTFLPPGPCAQQVYLPARSVGGSWLIGLRGTLPAGLYRVWSRATDGAGNREGVGLPGVNTLQFRVAPGRK
ncbi:MAG: hypothetical protein AB1416_08080 [Actinomycetota bacterium]